MFAIFITNLSQTISFLSPYNLNKYVSILFSMENDISGVLGKLENYKLSHPNIYSLWKEYINIKKQSYQKALVDCDDMLSLIGDTQDIPRLSIYLMYALYTAR